MVFVLLRINRIRLSTGTFFFVSPIKFRFQFAIRCALVAGIGKAFRCRRFDSLAVGGDCPADCLPSPTEPHCRFVCICPANCLRSPNRREIPESFCILVWTGAVFRRCANSVVGMAGWVTTVGTADPSPAFGKSPFPTAQMVRFPHGFPVEFFGQIPPVFPRFPASLCISAASPKSRCGRIGPDPIRLHCIPESPPPFKPGIPLRSNGWDGGTEPGSGIWCML